MTSDARAAMCPSLALLHKLTAQFARLRTHEHRLQRVSMRPSHLLAHQLPMVFNARHHCFPLCAHRARHAAAKIAMARLLKGNLMPPCLSGNPGLISQFAPTCLDHLTVVVRDR
eukprot:944391-Prymnesium_polylepis.1